MKIDQTTLLIGGIVIVIGVVALAFYQSATLGPGKNLFYGLGKFFGEDTLTPGDEAQQAAMYGHYY